MPGFLFFFFPCALFVLSREGSVASSQVWPGRELSAFLKGATTCIWGEPEDVQIG